MQHAPTPVDTRLNERGAELAVTLAKLARAHARDVVAESSKLASAVRMGRSLAHNEGAGNLLKTADARTGAISMVGRAARSLLPAGEGAAAHAATPFLEGAQKMIGHGAQAAGSAASAIPHEAQQLLDLARKAEGGGVHAADISFLKNRAQQIAQGKPVTGASHEELMSAFGERFSGGASKAPSAVGGVAPRAVPKTQMPPPGAGRALPPSPGAAPAGGVTGAMHNAEAMYANTMTPNAMSAAKSPVGGVRPTANTNVRQMSTQELEAIPIKPSRQEALRTDVQERGTMQIERPAPTTAAPPTTTGAAPSPVGGVAPAPPAQPAGGLSSRDIALGSGGVALGGVGFGVGGVASGRGQHEQPRGMPPLPPGYPQMTVTASLHSLFKNAGMFANMGEGLVNMFAKKAPQVAGAGAQAAGTAAKKGMGWGTPLKIMAAGTGIGAAGAGIGAGALGVGHAVKQHGQFGSTAYQPQGPRSFMYPSQM